MESTAPGASRSFHCTQPAEMVVLCLSTASLSKATARCWHCLVLVWSFWILCNYVSMALRSISIPLDLNITCFSVHYLQPLAFSDFFNLGNTVLTWLDLFYEIPLLPRNGRTENKIQPKWAKRNKPVLHTMVYKILLQNGNPRLVHILSQTWCSLGGPEEVTGFQAKLHHKTVASLLHS